MLREAPERLTAVLPLGRPTSLLLDETLPLLTTRPDLESSTLPVELSTILVLEPDVALLLAEVPLVAVEVLLILFLLDDATDLPLELATLDRPLLEFLYDPELLPDLLLLSPE